MINFVTTNKLFHYKEYVCIYLNLCECGLGGGGLPARYAKRSSLRIMRLFFLAQFIISLLRFCFPVSIPSSLHRRILSTESVQRNPN